MSIPRHSFLRAISILIALSAWSGAAWAETKKIVASKSIAQVKAKAGGWVTLGSYAHSKTGTTTLQCRVVKKSLACQGVTKSAIRAIKVTAIRATKGQVELAPDSMTLVLEIAGDLKGLEPHPWDS